MSNRGKEDLDLPSQLHLRSQGLLSPDFLRNGVRRTRLMELAPSPFRDIPIAPTALFHADLDNEDRYLLTSEFDGQLRIVDLLTTSSNGVRREARVVADTRRGADPGGATHRGPVNVQWYPADNGIFLTGGKTDGKLQLWDANELRVAEKFEMDGNIHSHHSSKIASHQMVAVATDRSHVRLVDLKSGANVHELRNGHKSGPVLACRWSNRRESFLVSGDGNGSIVLWDVRSSKSFLKKLDYNDFKKSKRELSGKAHDGKVISLRFADDGLSLYSLGTDFKVRKWCLNTGCNMKAKFPRIAQASLLTVGANHLFIPTKSSVYVLNAQEEKAVGSLDNGHESDSSITFCCYNASYQEVYTGGMDANVVIWESNAESNSTYADHLRKVNE